MSEYERLINTELEQRQQDNARLTALKKSTEIARQEERHAAHKEEQDKAAKRPFGSPLESYFNETHRSMLLSFLDDAKKHEMKGSSKLKTRDELLRKGIWVPILSDYMFGKTRREYVQGYAIGKESSEEDAGNVYICKDGALRVDESGYWVGKTLSRPLESPLVVTGVWRDEQVTEDVYSNYYESWSESTYTKSVFHQAHISKVIANVAINNFRN